MDITVAPDFPKASYIEVEDHVSAYMVANDMNAGPGFAGYAGGWNALIMRYRAAHEDGVAAVASLSESTNLTNDERHSQEQLLFGFFANTMSAVESCCFAIYHLGKLARPKSFVAKEWQISAEKTSHDLAAAYPGTLLDSKLSALVVDQDWLDVKDIRNILLHRASPGRSVFVTTNGVERPPEWTGTGLVLDSRLISRPRLWLSHVVEGLVDATLDFVKANF